MKHYYLSAKFAAAAAAAILSASLMTGCGNITEKTDSTSSVSESADSTSKSVTKQKPSAKSTTKSDSKNTKNEITADDISIFIKGMDDVTVLQDTSDFDPCSLIYMDNQIINGIKADVSNVNYKKAGTYTVVYQISVNDTGYANYLKNKNSYKESFVKAVVLSKIDDNTTVVNFEQKLTVVTKATAEKEADKGVTVYSDNGETNKTDNSSDVKTSETKTSKSNASKTNTSKTNTSETKNTEKSETKQETTKTESTKKESTTTAHQHNFQPVYKTVHHDAQYTTKWVQDSAAWDETVSNGDAYDEPVYDLHNICYDCGMDLDAAGYTGEAVFEHIEAEMDNGGMGRYYNKRVQVDTIHHEGTTSVVHHDATGHNEQVLVKDAYDEQVIDHYECSCGATK